MFDPGPSYYMEKIAVGPDSVGSIDITASPTQNLRWIAKSKREQVQDLTAIILDRPDSKVNLIDLRWVEDMTSALDRIEQESPRGLVMFSAKPGNFIAGGFFRKGEVLLQIDPSDYETALLSAQAGLAARKAQLADQKARSEQAMKDWINLGRKGEPSDLTLRKPQLAEAEAATAEECVFASNTSSIPIGEIAALPAAVLAGLFVAGACLTDPAPPSPEPTATPGPTEVASTIEETGSEAGEETPEPTDTPPPTPAPMISAPALFQFHCRIAGCLILVQNPAADTDSVNLIRSVVNPGGAFTPIVHGNGCVIGHTQPAVNLQGPVQNPLHGIGHVEFYDRYVFHGILDALVFYGPGGIEHHQTR